MKFKGICLQHVDWLRSLKCSDPKRGRNFAKDLSVEVQTAALNVKVRNTAGCCLLLAGVIPVTSWLFRVENGRVYVDIWLEQSPEQVGCDLAMY